MENNSKYVKLNKTRETNFIKTSRPEMWVFVLVPYLIGATLSNNFNIFVLLLFTLPYNYFVYKFDDILEDKYDKGLYETLTAPVYYIFPFIIGSWALDIPIIIGLYMWIFGVNTVHAVGHKEIENIWGYIVFPIILIGAYLLQSNLLTYTFFVACCVVSFSHFILLATRTWRDDYWLVLFGFYVGLAIYEGVRFTTSS